MNRMHTQSEAFRDILKIIGRGKKLQRDLTHDEAREAMRLLLGNQVSDAQIGGFLLTMRVKEETTDEIRGFVEGAKTLMKPMPQPDVEGLVDFGLPFNGKTRTLQTGVISLMLVASAGVPTMIHGADNIPTKNGVGVLNMLRELGYPADQSPNEVCRSIEKTNFGVLNLTHVLPQWTALTPLRHHFGVRTLMNTVEKLLNPANAPRHISGFYHASYLHRLVTALPGKTANWIVLGEEGSVDIRLGKKTRVYQAVDNEMVETMIDTSDYGFPDPIVLEFPNNAESHAKTIRCMLDGENHPLVPQIILTSATILWMLGVTPNIEMALVIAQERWDSGCLQAMLNPT